MPKILFAGRPDDWQLFQPHLENALEKAGLSADLTTKVGNPAMVDYMLHAPSGPINDFTPFTGLKLVQSLWAGVENIVTNITLTKPLARMVDPGMIEGMVDYVTGNVLRHHLGTDIYAAAKPGEWLAETAPPLARQRTVGILGIGALGMACAAAVQSCGFKVLGWSRSQKSQGGITCLSGVSGLTEILSRSEILVLLLPRTQATENILNKASIAMMPKGASVINPGRGPLIDDTALLEALNSNHIRQATLDVFRSEPLPAIHPFWAHPKVLVTPHIASETRPETSSEVAVENIRRGESGEDFLHLVDFDKGY